MRSLFSGEICATADKFKFAFERSFEILLSRVLLLGVEFPANFAAKILNGKIPPSKILSNEALLSKILLGRNPLLGASSRKISYPWIYERKISARKISFFEILKTLQSSCGYLLRQNLPRALSTLVSRRISRAKNEILQIKLYKI